MQTFLVGFGGCFCLFTTKYIRLENGLVRALRGMHVHKRRGLMDEEVLVSQIDRFRGEWMLRKQRKLSVLYIIRMVKIDNFRNYMGGSTDE